jgi:hypothetical protein
MGTRQAYSQVVGVSCPVVAVACPDADFGPTLTFAASVQAAPSAKLTFNWTVSAGTITSGQGTASITVDTSGFEPVDKSGFDGQSVTATVEVGGDFPTECPNKASCSTGVSGSVRALKFAEYGNLSIADERAVLDNFASYLQRKTPTSPRRPNAYRKPPRRGYRTNYHHLPGQAEF